jgi:thermostable 8-oxoguanine DNA glycosylase
MLKHLREMGIEDVPKSTPSSKKKYMILEQEVLRLADEAGIDIAVYDLMIWNKYSVKSIRILDK